MKSPIKFTRRGYYCKQDNRVLTLPLLEITAEIVAFRDDDKSRAMGEMIVRECVQSPEKVRVVGLWDAKDKSKKKTFHFEPCLFFWVSHLASISDPPELKDSLKQWYPCFPGQIDDDRIKSFVWERTLGQFTAFKKPAPCKIGDRSVETIPTNRIKYFRWQSEHEDKGRQVLPIAGVEYIDNDERLVMPFCLFDNPESFITEEALRRVKDKDVPKIIVTGMPGCGPSGPNGGSKASRPAQAKSSKKNQQPKKRGKAVKLKQWDDEMREITTQMEQQGKHKNADELYKMVINEFSRRHRKNKKSWVMGKNY